MGFFELMDFPGQIAETSLYRGRKTFLYCQNLLVFSCTICPWPSFKARGKDWVTTFGSYSCFPDDPDTSSSFARWAAILVCFFFCTGVTDTGTGYFSGAAASAAVRVWVATVSPGLSVGSETISCPCVLLTAMRRAWQAWARSQHIALISISWEFLGWQQSFSKYFTYLSGFFACWRHEIPRNRRWPLPLALRYTLPHTLLLLLI